METGCKNYSMSREMKEFILFLTKLMCIKILLNVDTCTMFVWELNIDPAASNAWLPVLFFV